MPSDVQKVRAGGGDGRQFIHADKEEGIPPRRADALFAWTEFPSVAEGEDVSSGFV